MLGTTAAALTLVVIFVLWVLYVLFVKPSYSGTWVNVSNSKVYLKHNKFTEKIDGYKYDKNGVITPTIDFTARSCGELIILNENTNPTYMIYDKKTDTINPVANVVGESMKRVVVVA